MSLFNFSQLAHLTQSQATTTITQQNNTTSLFEQAAYNVGYLLIYPHGTSKNYITSHHKHINIYRASLISPCLTKSKNLSQMTFKFRGFFPDEIDESF